MDTITHKKQKNIDLIFFERTWDSKMFLLLTLICGMFYTIPVMAQEGTPIPSYITDGTLFELEGETPHPLINDTTLQFLPLEAQVATPNGNGWRHEYKIDQPHRLPMGATYERFEATYTVDMSDGAKAIIVQYHGDSPTLMKLYYADTEENGLVDSVGGNGIFDLYVRLRSVELNGGEDVFAFGTLEAGDTFDVIVENKHGEVSVTALGETITRVLMETPTDYLKFGNYLQAQVTTDTEHQYGGEKCRDFDPPLGFAECYEQLGITHSVVTLTNVSYERTINEDYVFPPPDPNLGLLNGDFEDSLNGWVQEEPVAHSGDTYSGDGSAKIGGEPGRFYQRVQVMADTEYVFSGYVKGEGAIGVKNTEYLDDVATDEVDLSESFDVDDWTKYTITFTTGTDPLPIYVYGMHGSSGDVRFDDFSLETDSPSVAGNDFCPSMNGAPATAFDLAHWRIKVPDVDGTTYSPAELATLDNEFFCLTDDGAMAMYAPVNGGTDGSKYPRTELREMVDPESSSVGWPITGTHTMSATTTVAQQPSNGKIVIAQVDSHSDDILGKIQWQSGKIKVQLRQIGEDGTTGDYADFWFDEQNESFPVGTPFSWNMTVEDGVLSVSVNGETTTHDFTLIPESTTPSDYADDAFYFSAGSQPQDNTLDEAGEAGAVLFHSLDVIHDDGADMPETPETPETPDDVQNAPIPSYITDGTLFELEGETPHPLINDTTLQFLPLEAQVATPNGNGWRHEYKIDQPHRLPMGATYERFEATYTVDMSDGAKSIIVQYHGDSPTLMKLYYADTEENGLVDSVGGNGIFDLYVRLRSVELNGGEDVFAFGTLEAGDTFTVIVENNHGEVSVTALGQTITRVLMETPTDYLKFGNYLQAQVTTDTEHQYGGEKCRDFDPPLGFAECYEQLGITHSVVTLTNVSYERTINEDYVFPPPDPNLGLLNGDFEDSLNGWVQEEPVAHSGDTYSGDGSAKIGGEPGRFYQRVQVMADTEYVFSGYVKGEGAIGVKNTEYLDDVATDEVDLSESFDVDDWTKYTITFTTGTDPLPIYVYGMHGSSGDVRFDDFSLETDSPSVAGNDFCPSMNGAPATAFDLAHWRIKVPDVDGTTYSPAELATLDNEFFCLTDDGAMAMYAPVNGGTDGSKYPRTELREMVDPESSSVGWPITGTHTMSATTTVAQQPSNGKIVIAQVDSHSDDILGKIQWQSGKIKVQLRQIGEDGAPGDYADFWFDEQNESFPVGTPFSWNMIVEDGVLSVSVNDETTTHEFTLIPESTTPSDYADDAFYFSAGSQPQDNTLDEAGEAGAVLFHSLDVIHDDGADAPVPSEPELGLELKVDPDSLNAEGQVRPGDTVIFMLDVTNPGEVTVHDVELIGTVPEGTSFDKASSDLDWNIYEGLLRSQMQGTCPEGHEAGEQCVLALGDLAPGQSVTDIRFGVNVSEDIEADSELTLNFPAQLSGAGLDGGELDLSMDESADVVVDTTPVDAVPLDDAPVEDVDAPTSLIESEEPPERKLFLPLISR